MLVIGQYRCGCSYGPVDKRQRRTYCGTHGDDIQDEYKIPKDGKEATGGGKIMNNQVKKQRQGERQRERKRELSQQRQRELQREQQRQLMNNQ